MATFKSGDRVEIRNSGGEPIAVRSVALVDSKGTCVDNAGTRWLNREGARPWGQNYVRVYTGPTIHALTSDK